jgi:hypothetical protein
MYIKHTILHDNVRRVVVIRSEIIAVSSRPFEMFSIRYYSRNIVVAHRCTGTRQSDCYAVFAIVPPANGIESNDVLHPVANSWKSVTKIIVALLNNCVDDSSNSSIDYRWIISYQFSSRASRVMEPQSGVFFFFVIPHKPDR